MNKNRPRNDRDDRRAGKLKTHVIKPENKPIMGCKCEYEEERE